MSNENGRSMPDKYYFDDESKDAVPESEIISSENAAAEVKTETIATTPEVKLSAKEIASQRRENLSRFFKEKKDSLKNSVQSVGANIKSFFGKVKAFGKNSVDTAINVAVAPDAYISKGVESVNNFIDKKNEQLDNFVKGKAELLKLFAEFTQYKTVEKYEGIKSGIEARYNALKQYGEDAVESGKSRVREVKDGIRNKKNSIIIAALRSVSEGLRSKADAVEEKISLLESIKA